MAVRLCLLMCTAQIAHYNCITTWEAMTMKTSTLPAIRVNPELREAAERALRPNETLSKLMETALENTIAQRAADDEFVARALRSSQSARQANQYIPAAEVLSKLDGLISAAQKKMNAVV
jgi:hypothetical protein